MKLYYSPGACSLAPHIALSEAGLPYDTAKVDLRKHTLADGTDYYTINPKGYVPLLELDDGTRLSEVAVILQYIADRKPGTLAPAFGGMDRYRLMEWLNFIATELHKQFSPLWYPTTPDATKEAQRTKLASRFEYLSKDARRTALPHGAGVHHCRRVSLHHPQLGADAQGRPVAVSRPDGVPGARRRAARRASRARRPKVSSRAKRRRPPPERHRRLELDLLVADFEDVAGVEVPRLLADRLAVDARIDGAFDEA